MNAVVISAHVFRHMEDRLIQLSGAIEQNYLKGIGEPTTASLEKLADYFGVSVVELTHL